MKNNFMSKIVKSTVIILRIISTVVVFTRNIIVMFFYIPQKREQKLRYSLKF